ncbi:hypothetical protein OH77DRAFT_1419054 [Trametes cingulata]|nr:hypothetical protein OH77DRAFT_1419054 [Trametes cingulata]
MTRLSYGAILRRERSVQVPLSETAWIITSQHYVPSVRPCHRQGRMDGQWIGRSEYGAVDERWSVMKRPNCAPRPSRPAHARGWEWQGAGPCQAAAAEAGCRGRSTPFFAGTRSPSGGAGEGFTVRAFLMHHGDELGRPVGADRPSTLFRVRTPARQYVE